MAGQAIGPVPHAATDLRNFNRKEELMDLRAYYGKIRETEALLEGEDVVVVSLKTSEG